MPLNPQKSNLTLFIFSQYLGCFSISNSGFSHLKQSQTEAAPFQLKFGFLALETIPNRKCLSAQIQVSRTQSNPKQKPLDSIFNKYNLWIQIVKDFFVIFLKILDKSHKIELIQYGICKKLMFLNINYFKINFSIFHINRDFHINISENFHN